MSKISIADLITLSVEELKERNEAIIAEYFPKSNKEEIPLDTNLEKLTYPELLEVATKLQSNYHDGNINTYLVRCLD